MIEEQLNNAKDKKIRRMREAQLANAEADFQSRLEEFEESMKKADIITEIVINGVIKVIRG
jgi:hypothetical protein